MAQITPVWMAQFTPALTTYCWKKVHIVLTSVHKIHFAYFQSQPYTSQKNKWNWFLNIRVEGIS